VTLAGFLMTPDAAFGFERRGTPATLTALGERDGFDVVVIPTFNVDGQEIRSSTIREAIAAGDLATAARLLGRQVTFRGPVEDGVDGRARLDFPLPVALPPDGDYEARVDGRSTTLSIVAGEAFLPTDVARGRVSVALAPR
jgi:FAD synthase